MTKYAASAIASASSGLSFINHLKTSFAGIRLTPCNPHGVWSSAIFKLKWLTTFEQRVVPSHTPTSGMI
ncbi:MAG: hypothetical protein KME28_20360 [Pelatocladus maniniholoensis HA4357-MV3]|jgi:hypothetical protein|uniref:Uncharacterized protein n=1 Tax=Pelatocladus maniniholoensis HA4357-MV3 TaxID=1117104 RepID=A0A9E3HB17_9NOST|nr:hypothetical protein [Pelatocladus maniniholoensis HA4357-MV3]